MKFMFNLKLYEIAKKDGITESVEFIKFDYNLGCGHRNIWTAPNIIDIIKYNYFL